MDNQFLQIFDNNKPLIGVIQVDPLPGSPRWRNKVEETILKAEQEALALTSSNINGLMVQCHVSSQQKTLDPSAIGLMSLIIGRIKRLTQLPVGVSVLENDAVSALSIAYSAQCDWIRVPLLIGASLGHSGWNKGCVAELEARFQTLYGKLNNELPIPVVADISLSQELPGQGKTEKESATLSKLAEHILDRCPWVDAFLVSVNDINNINLLGLNTFLSESNRQPVMVLDTLSHLDNQQAEQLLPALLHQASGVILDTSIRKANIAENWGQSTIDAAKVESLVRHLRDEKSIEELGKEYFLNQM